MPSNPETQEIPQDIASMSKTQRLAVLMIVLGSDSAAQLLGHLDEPEIEAVTAEMARIPVVSHEMRQEILAEFSSVASQAGNCTLGGMDVARSTLEKSVGQFRASNILGRVAPARSAPGAMQQILEMDAKQIFNLLKHEQPQTIALVASYLAPEKASQMLMCLSQEERDRVVERLATLAPTPVEVVERIVELLNHMVSGRHSRGLNRTGGVKNAAEVLNSMGKDVSKALLSSLEERNPELGAAIRNKMFTFDDLVTLDSSTLQKILREVDMRDLAVALKNANDKVKAALLASISKRAAETVNEEIGFLGPLRVKEIEAAQGRIIDAVRRLEAEGELELGGGGGATDDVVA